MLTEAEQTNKNTVVLWFHGLLVLAALEVVVLGWVGWMVLADNETSPRWLAMTPELLPCTTTRSAASAARASVQVPVTSEPSGAAVRACGRVYGYTPLTVLFPSDEPVALSVWLDGYEAKRLFWTPDYGTRALRASLFRAAGP